MRRESNVVIEFNIQNKMSQALRKGRIAGRNLFGTLYKLLEVNAYSNIFLENQNCSTLWSNFEF